MGKGKKRGIAPFFQSSNATQYLHFAHKFFPCNGAGIRIKFNKIHAENKPPFFRQMGGMNVA